MGLAGVSGDGRIRVLRGGDPGDGGELLILLKNGPLRADHAVDGAISVALAPADDAVVVEIASRVVGEGKLHGACSQAAVVANPAGVAQAPANSQTTRGKRKEWNGD